MKTMPLVTKVRGVVLGIAALVVAVPSVTTAQRVEYYHLDALGSVRAITDASGDVITRHDYLPYGEEWDPQPSSDTRRFTGKERDSENGLDYFGARYYGTSTAIFTSVDPAMTVDANLVDPQRWNRYAYARGNPQFYVDPDGRVIDTIVDIGSILYDVYDIGSTLVRGGQVTTMQYAALGGDVVGAVVPGLTGGGAAIRAAGKADDVVDTVKGIDHVSDATGEAPNRIYSARELIRRAEEPGPFHNFPESFNEQIFQGTRRVVRDDYVLYTQRGSITLPGREVTDAAGNIVRSPSRVVTGTFEIGVRPSASGRTEVITHRFFRPDP